MNKACKVIWSHIHRHMVVVSELVRGRGKTQSTRTATGGPDAGTTANMAATEVGIVPTLALCMAVGFGVLAADRAAAQDLPTGAQVVAGQASVSTSGANMVIDQTTQRAAINWQSFNVGAGAHVHFNQPSSSASTLNRVIGSQASTILGRITAPGQVIISNGNGVYFGRGATVDVGSLVATTHSIGVDRFMAGELVFERNGATGSVVNEGELRAKLEGYIALIAPEVRNEGLIVAHKGTVALAAGEVVELQLDPANKLANLRVEAGQWQALVDNQHAIEAEGGLVILTAMAVRELQGGVVRHSGSISANSLAHVGGRVLLTGDDITLQAGSTITATGVTGGGAVLVGGDWQGGANEQRRVFADPNALHQATTVTMEGGALIDASATDNGKGGTVVLWSDAERAGTETTFAGTILARGGMHGGDGGWVETSGYTLNPEGGFVNAGSDHGKGGLWLLDPSDAIITQAIADGYRNTLDTGTSVENLVSNGNITWNSGVTLTKTAGGDATLTLKTRGTNTSTTKGIAINGGAIISTSGALNVVIWTDSDQSFIGHGRAHLSNVNIDTNGGHFWIGSGAATNWNGLSGGGGSAYTYQVNDSAVNISGSSISTGSGSIRISGEVFHSGGSGTNYGINVTNSSISTTSGNIQLTGTVKGLYTHGIGVRVGGGDTTISSTTGNINISGQTLESQAGTNWRHGIVLRADVSSDLTIIRTTSGAINLVGSVNSTFNDASGVQLQASGVVQVVSQSGAINLNGTANSNVGQFSNGIRLAAANAVDRRIQK